MITREEKRREMPWAREEKERKTHKNGEEREKEEKGDPLCYATGCM